MSPVSILHSALLQLWFRIKGIRFDGNCRLEPGCRVRRGRSKKGRGSVRIGDNCSLGRNCQIQAWGGQISFMKGVQIGDNTSIHGQGGIVIGVDTRIDADCLILSAHRALPPHFQADPAEPEGLLPTKIGAKVRLEKGVIVLGGVSIGDGCVVRSGSIVVNDLPTEVEAAGIPARPQ